MHKIAVIDDDEYWGLAIQRFLRNDFEVKVFTSGRTFFKNAEEFDLVIVDFTILPSGKFENIVNGYELIQSLKMERSPSPLALLASGYIRQNDLGEMMQSCPLADGFIAKDAGLDALRIQIERLLSSQQPKF